MAHFAELADKNVVARVIVVSNSELLVDGVESEAKGIDFLESLFGHRRWKQTSYNKSFRANFAGIGFSYDEVLDAFIAPQPFPSWILNDASRWTPPVPRPGGPHRWDEDTQTWVPLPKPLRPAI